MNQSRSGAPSVDLLSKDNADFMRHMGFLKNHINRRKWLVKKTKNACLES